MKLVRNMRISTKIIVLYAVVLCFSLGIYGLAFVISEKVGMEREICKVSEQTVETLRKNIITILDDLDSFTNVIIYDDNVQSSLDKIDKGAIDPNVNRDMQEYLSGILLSSDYIESVFVFDRYKNYYVAKRISPIIVNSDVEVIESLVEKASDTGVYIHNAGLLFEYPEHKEHNTISHIRNINSISNYDKVATLIMNIDINQIAELFEEINDEYGSVFFVVDKDSDEIIYSGSTEKTELNLINKVLDGSLIISKNGIVEFNSNKYCICTKMLGINNWEIVGLFSLDSYVQGIKKRDILFAFITICNICVVCIYTFAIKRLLFSPLKMIENHMKKFEESNLEEIAILDRGKNEIVALKEGYNLMISSIKKMIEQIKEEDTIVAKNELELLFAQINPHFLYNTLDGISALALMGDNKKCFEMTQSLGKFYRNSLNSGKKLVSVIDELECIRNYINILNIRYDGGIELKVEVDEAILDLQILKLVLQPLVENAVHHGIRSRNNRGTIKVSGYLCDDEIIMSVADDGIGISKDKIAEIMEEKSQGNKSGFGLFGEIRRIRLFYGIEKPMYIISEEGSGTEVIITLKVLTEADENEIIGGR